MTLIPTVKGDYIICMAVLIQPVLILLQSVLIDVYRMPLETSTTYRVILTAIPMVLAIIVGTIRKPARFVLVYIIASIVLFMSIAIHPQNADYIKDEGLRFFLPVVLPTVICLSTLKNWAVFKKSLDIISWVSAFLTLYYIFHYYIGTFFIDVYNMSFSYGCLLPMIVLFSHRRFFPIVISILLFIWVLAIGSRGAVIAFIVYIVIDAFLNKRKGRWLLFFIGLIFLSVVPLLYDYFDSIGIHSRTLDFFLSGVIDYDTGRDYLYEKSLREIMQHPFTGIGLWGDRVLLDGFYSHNFFIEVLLDFGLFVGLILLLWFLYFMVNAFVTTKDEKRDTLLILVASGLIPSFVSGSYLTSSPMGLLFGYVFFLANQRKRYGQ